MHAYIKCDGFGGCLVKHIGNFGAKGLFWYFLELFLVDILLDWWI